MNLANRRGRECAGRSSAKLNWAFGSYHFPAWFVPFLRLRADDLATGFAVWPPFAVTRSAALFATFADFLDVLPAIVFTPGLRRRCVARGATWWHMAARTSTDR